MTPAEELALQDAYYEGARAGRLLFGPSMNPYADNCPEYQAWERGRFGAVTQRMAGSFC